MLCFFQTEVYAILQCARLKSLCVRDNASIAICSDSLAALKSLSAAKITSALVADTVQALRQLAVFNSLRLVWVPGRILLNVDKLNSLLNNLILGLPDMLLV